MDRQTPVIAASRHLDSMASDLSASAAEQAGMAIAATRRAADSAARSVQAGLDSLPEKVPSMLTHAGTAADAFMAQAVQRARDASSAVRDTTGRAHQRAAAYIRAEPLKAVLIGVGTGALVALILSSRSRR